MNDLVNDLINMYGGFECLVYGMLSMFVFRRVMLPMPKPLLTRVLNVQSDQCDLET